MIKPILNGEIMEQTPERDIFYTYWQDLPFTKDVSMDDYRNLLDNPIRQYILTTMSKGVEDEYGQSFHDKRRHAFSIKELHQMYSEKNTYGKMTVQNFHFHMKTLLDLGLVKEFKQKILEDRHYVTYYGRTTKMIENFDVGQSFKAWQKSRIGPLKQMISQLNPDADEQEISDRLDDYLQHVLDYYLRMYSWMEQNYQNFYDAGMDIQQFVFMAMNFSVFDEELQEDARYIAQMLNLDNINDYPPYNPEE
jgi:hypothetical protein